MMERTENGRLLSTRWERKGSVVNTVPELLTVDEVAALRRIGRRVLISRTELLHWLDHNCASSPKE